MDRAKHYALDSGTAQRSRVHRIEHFQRSKGVFIAAARAAHALPDFMALERSAKQPTDELAAAVGVLDQAPTPCTTAGVLQCFHAKRCLHMFRHRKARMLPSKQPKAAAR